VSKCPNQNQGQLTLPNVGQYEGKSLDLKLKVVSGVVLRTNVTNEGFIELRVPQDGAILDLTIVESGTSTPVQLPEVHFTVFDIDGCVNSNCQTSHGKPLAGQEELDVCTNHIAVQTPTTLVKPGQDFGCTTYTSEVGGQLDNQPYTTALGGQGFLSQVAKDLSVELVFKNLAEVRLGYKVIGSENPFRTLLLDGFGEITRCVGRVGSEEALLAVQDEEED